ncbi:MULTISPECIES: hypothetical protein [Streptomyces]|uniref:hypothetical protein n=1 Tax=Streptomyces TaxID=1883 RepID=UPI001EFA86C9|nr:hypothetical protein [Streptomyces sp. CL12-4]MCG8971701.1 hypothetical protein [Streptomyces sp. CL12-4]
MAADEAGMAALTERAAGCRDQNVPYAAAAPWARAVAKSPAPKMSRRGRVASRSRRDRAARARAEAPRRREFVRALPG